MTDQNKLKKLKNLILLFPIAAFFFCFYKSISAVAVHGFNWHVLIPVISGYLIYDQRSSIFNSRYNSNPLVGSLVLIIAFILIFTGTVTSTLVITEMAIVLGLWGCVLYYGGYRLFLRLLWPLLYLVFISSATEGWFDLFTPYFRHLSAAIATILAKSIGYTIFLSETYIRLPFMVLNVANECSGVNHFISLLAIALPLAFLSQSKLIPRAIIVLSTLPFALFSNSIRVFLLIIFNYNRTEFTHGPKNILVTGSGFLIGLILLMVLSKVMNRLFTEKISVAKKEKESFQQSINVKTTITLTVILIFGALLNVIWTIKDGTTNLDALNLKSDLFQVEKVASIPGIENLPIADSEQKLKFTDKNNNSIYFYVGWHARQNQDNEVAGFIYDKLFHNVKNIAYTNLSIPFRTCESSSGENNFQYLIGYHSRSGYTAKSVLSKLYTVKDALLYRTTSASIIIFAIPDQSVITSECIQTLIDSVFPVIRVALVK